MRQLLPRKASLVWLFLMAATLCSWWLAESHGAGEWTVPAVMLVAALKGRAVMLHFMELMTAPWIWRLVFEVWIWLCTGTIAVLYWGSRLGV